jgi:hypothetical protein
MNEEPTTEKCARCGREVDIDSPELLSGEALDAAFMCEGCVTPEDRQRLDEDDMALIDAMDDAGLGADVDAEAMDDDEYEMREQLAHVFYEQDSADEED